MGNQLKGADAERKVTIRASSSLIEDVDRKLEASEEYGNRSDLIRNLLRAWVSEPEPEEGLVPPSDDKLASAYRELLAICSPDGWVRFDIATAILAQQLNVPQQAVYAKLVKPLKRRGYVTEQSTPSTGTGGRAFRSLRVRGV